MRGESFAVASSNNSATKNALEKLQKYGVDFIAAYLGNIENKRDFINSQKPLPDMSKWKLEQQTVAELRWALKLRYGELCEKIARQNELAALKQELSAQKHFLSYSGRIITAPNPAAARAVNSSRHTLEMWLMCETYEESARRKGLIAFIKSILERLGLIGGRTREVRTLLEQYPREYLIAFLQYRFYELKIVELTQSVSALYHDLESFDFGAKMREFSNRVVQ
ncbi:MAG: hypothetical protein LBG43_07495 [Treponema sp.]|jgi:hypothetical protein|nr:hypothetical protein [Treponema sp.]